MKKICEIWTFKLQHALAFSSLYVLISLLTTFYFENVLKHQLYSLIEKSNYFQSNLSIEDQAQRKFKIEWEQDYVMGVISCHIYILLIHMPSPTISKISFGPENDTRPNSIAYVSSLRTSIKLTFSEKATKFEKIPILVLTLLKVQLISKCPFVTVWTKIPTKFF